VDVPLREGESPAAGTVVARLDDLDISREITSARARLSAARSRLAEADNSYGRQRTLADRGLVARATLDQIVCERDTTSADLKVAQTELQIAQDRLTKTRLVAARAGVVTRLVTKQYEEVAAGAAVYEVGSGESLEAEVLVPAQIVTLLKLGAPVEVRIPGLGDATIAATIVEIGAGADSGNAFRVKARLAATPSTARSGMTAVLASDVGGEARMSFDIPTAARAFENTVTEPGAGTEARVSVLDEQAQRAFLGFVLRLEVSGSWPWRRGHITCVARPVSRNPEAAAPICGAAPRRHCALLKHVFAARLEVALASNPPRTAGRSSEHPVERQ
jgi:RND family efflux transporter MFP subunit